MTARQTPPPPRDATERGLLAGGASDCAPGISLELRAELQAWYDWTLRGAPNGQPFYRNWGLCPSVGRNRAEIEAILGELFPFGEDDYKKRLTDSTQHECPKRLAWVRKMLGVQS